jgi:hypothetical protein
MEGTEREISNARRFLIDLSDASTRKALDRNVNLEHEALDKARYGGGGGPLLSLMESPFGLP